VFPAALFRDGNAILASAAEGSMRCYFMHEGVVEGVEELGDIADADAVRLARELLAEPLIWQGGLPPGAFEIWDGGRLVHRHRPDGAAKDAGGTTG
jgi:hypothetical protein